MGEASDVVVFRGGKEVTLSVVLGELPENPQTASRGRPGGAGQQSALGVTVRDLAANRLDELDVDGGAEVVAVEGIAEDAGMRVGDVVLRMKGRVIDDADTLRDVAEAAEPGDVIPVLVLRQQGNAASTVTLPCGYPKTTRFFTKMLPESVLRLTRAKPTRLIAISVPPYGLNCASFEQECPPRGK